MAVTFYKPDVDVLKAQAEAARKASEEKKRGNDLLWARWATGDNILRLLPSTNTRGELGKKVSKHKFSDAMQKITGVKDVICVLEMFGQTCKIHDTADKLAAMNPTLDLDRWAAPTTHWFMPGYPRDDADHPASSLLYRFTPTMRNWVVITQEQILIKHGIDITSLDKGLDIKVSMSEAKSKGGKGFIKYDCSIWSPTGPCPLHSDPAFSQAIIDSVQDVDLIWKIPDDEKHGEILAVAAKIESFYMRKLSAHNAPATNGAVWTPPVSQAATSPSPAAASAVTHSPQVAPQSVPTPPQIDFSGYGFSSQVESNVVPLPQPPSIPKSQLHSVPQQAVTPVAISPHAVPPRSPIDKPQCFGGAAPRNDAAKAKEPDTGIGYCPDSEVCLLCKFELSCMELCAQKAVVK